MCLNKTKNSISFIIFITLFIFSTLLTMMYTGCGEHPNQPNLYPYSISGMIKDAKDRPMMDLSVTLFNSNTNSYMGTSTYPNGSYRFAITKEEVGQNYIVTPTKANYHFSPTSATINNLNSNQTANFIGTEFSPPVYYSISGIITDSAGIPMSDIEVSVGGYFPAIITNTDNNGFYIFPNLPAGDYYSVGPHHIDYRFSPYMTRVFPLLSNQTANFIGRKRIVEFNCLEEIEND